MSTKYKVGDSVKVLGFTEEFDWIRYITADEDHEENMDKYIGQILEVIEVDPQGDNDEMTSYKLEDCPFWWVDQWIERVDQSQLPGQMSIEDFGLVVSG